MKVLFDTSVLVASLVRVHPHHEPSIGWHQKAAKGLVEFLVAGHTLAELYAVLTRLPVNPRILPAVAWQLVERNVASKARTVNLGAGDYRSVLSGLAGRGLAGGIAYDALIARAAEKAGADVLLTLNVDHFRRAWPEAGSRIRRP